jgi:hypothetical protein
VGNNWYCNLAVTGKPTEIEGLRKVLKELWWRVEIKDNAPGAVSASTIEWGVLADG